VFELADNFLLPIVLVLGFGVVVLLGIYNVIAGVLFLRESIDGNASVIAKTAWVVSGVALTAWCMPCVGTGAAIVAMVLARFERNRIYDSRSPLASATPVRMARINGGWSLALQFVGYASVLIGEVVG